MHVFEIKRPGVGEEIEGTQSRFFKNEYQTYTDGKSSLPVRSSQSVLPLAHGEVLVLSLRSWGRLEVNGAGAGGHSASAGLARRRS